MTYMIIARDHEKRNVSENCFSEKSDALTLQASLEELDEYSEVVLLKGSSREDILNVYPEYRP